jgi:hypothetical protein
MSVMSRRLSQACARIATIFPRQVAFVVRPSMASYIHAPWHRLIVRHARTFFDGAPRGKGYTHFKSSKGHSDSGARMWYAIIAAVPGSLMLYCMVILPSTSLHHLQPLYHHLPCCMTRDSRKNCNGIGNCTSCGDPAMHRSTSTARRSRAAFG